MDDFDEKREELEEKVRLLEERLDELEDDPEKNEVPPYSEITLDGSQFLVHWITAEEIDTYSECSEIDNTYKAQVAFKEAASFRDDIENPGRPVLHGDLLVLQCNRSKSEDDYEETEDPNSCYFIGMCVFVDGSFQEESTEEDITCKHTSGDEVIREFVAWDTCGGAEESCPEELDDDGNPIPPTTADITEVTLPTSSDTGGTLLTEYTQYSEASSSLGSFITDLDVEESDDDEELDFLEANYRIRNDSDETIAVRIKHTPKVLKQKKISPLKSAVSLTNTVTQFAKKVIRTTTLPFKKITLASDKCGNLSREPDPDQGSYEPDSTQEVVKEIDDTTGNISITSAALSTESEDEDSENVIESSKIEDNEDSLLEFSVDEFLVIPQINGTQTSALKRTDSVDYVERIALEGTPEVDSTGSDNHVVTIKLKPTVKTANYASGLYLNTEDAETLSQPFEIKFNIPKAEEPDPDSGSYQDIEICEDGTTKTIRVRVYPMG